MKINISKSDIIWNYIGIIVSLSGNFVLIPFLLHFLSVDYYGLWNVFISLGTISVLFDFGFNSLFSRNIAYAWSGADHLKKEGVVSTSEVSNVNWKLLKSVVKTCKFIYLVISSVALLFMLSLGTIYVIHVGKAIGNDKIIIISWTLYALGIFLDLLYGYYDAFLRGIGEIGTDNKARIIAKFIQIIVTIIMLMLGNGIISTSIANIIYGFIFRGICKRRFYSVNNMKENLERVGKVELKNIWKTFNIVWYNAWREGIVSLANFISNQATTLLCSLFLGLRATASFGLAVQFTSGVAQISASLFSTYLPSIQESYVHRRLDNIRSDVSFGLTTYTLLFPIGILVIVLLIPAINLIKGNSILNVDIVLGVAVYQFLLKYRDCYAWYLAATNRVIYYKSFIMASILCIIMSIFFVECLDMGVQGFILSQIISQLVHNVWYWPMYVNKELGLTFRKKIVLFKKRVNLTFHSYFS